MLVFIFVVTFVVGLFDMKVNMEIGEFVKVGRGFGVEFVGLVFDSFIIFVYFFR